MEIFVFLCLLVAVLVFAGSVIGVASRVDLIPLGLLAIALSLFVPALDAL